MSSFLPPSTHPAFCTCEALCVSDVWITTFQHGQDPLPGSLESSAKETLPTSTLSGIRALWGGIYGMPWEQPGHMTQMASRRKWCLRSQRVEKAKQTAGLGEGCIQQTWPSVCTPLGRSQNWLLNSFAKTAFRNHHSFPHQILSPRGPQNPWFFHNFRQCCLLLFSLPLYFPVSFPPLPPKCRCPGVLKV